MGIDKTPKQHVMIKSKTYQIKVILVEKGADIISEEISRVFELAGNNTLHDLHSVIQEGFDWGNDHLYAFFMNNKLWNENDMYSENQTSIQLKDVGLRKRSRFLYLFDYGDELVHQVVVEKVTTKDSQAKKLPVLLNKTGIAPPQYQ